MATILHFLSIGDGSSYELHNLPFSYKIDVTDQDYTLWDPFEFEFCGQVNNQLIISCLIRRHNVDFYAHSSQFTRMPSSMSALHSFCDKHQSFQPLHRKSFLAFNL